ncbi:MAG: AAA family ATPase [Bacteroidetes bacterium]|nr:AAA family ATPase [Bacteroidota bacterium]MBT6684758.1 AAA family ATPase [Bacteroidota bacterium]MBT7143344.1 AAA family ATPase [Bacteroidota bacterium]MBT7493182.1 AAA family ATPase [Bacteroidota bacterium]
MNNINPFIYNSPVLNKDFFNREKMIENILKETIIGKTQGDVWLTGERQTGKTSFLKYLFSNNNKYWQNELPIYGTDIRFKPLFCFANVQYCVSEHEFYNELWQSLKNELDFKMKKEKKSKTNFINAIKYAYSKNIFPVLLIDEFDAFLETLAIEDPKLVRHFVVKLNSFLKNFLDIQNKVFSCIFTSNQDFIDINNKYDLKITGSGIIAEIFDLDWFTENQIISLAKHYLENSKIQFTEKELKFVFKYTKGYPYFTQKIFSLMYDYKQKVKSEQIDNLVVREFIKTEYESTIKFWLGQNMPKRTFEKLNTLLKNTGEKVFDTALKIFVEYSKSEFK